MKFLTWTEKMIVKKIALEILEQAFNKDIANAIYLACSEPLFNEVEQSEWFQDDKPILAEYIEAILGAFIEDALRFKFEGEQE